MDIWSVLAFVTVSNLFMMGAFSLGAYFVYRTKREDGYMFKNVQAQDTSKPIILDDLGSDMGDSPEPPEDLLRRNSRFLDELGIRGVQ